MEMLDAVFVIAVIIMSAVVHEVMHGVAADKLGDPTARLMGRLTLNPLPHLDSFGSVFLPAILALTNSPLFFGWAKPVPYNPYNLGGGRFGEALVAAAGPLSNLAIALFFGLLIRLAIFPALQSIFFIIVLVNVMLFLFNLIPIPPLDGSKVLASILPRPLALPYDRIRASLEMNPFLGFGLVLLFVIGLGGALGSVVYSIAQALAGL